VTRLLLLLALTLAVVAADWRIAIRVRGTVEVSADGQSWTSLIRNRQTGDGGLVRTGADSVGQLRTAGDTLYVLGPQSLVRVEADGLRLQSGALRLEGRGRILTRLGTVEAQEPEADCCLGDLPQRGMVCEVFEGWVRIHPPKGPPADVDGGERAVWGESGLTEKAADRADIPIDLRPPPED
jgi:hypothetical protein